MPTSDLITATQTAPASPVWLQLLIAVLPFLVGALVALHPLLKLSAWLKSHTNDANQSAVAKLAYNGSASLSMSVDHFLEANQKDFADLADPLQRAAALAHLKTQLEAGALPAAAAAAEAMGSSWLAGAASQAVDLAAAKAAPAAGSPS